MKKAIVVSIMNDYDWLEPIETGYDGWDLFCITDSDLNTDKPSDASIIKRRKKALNEWTIIKVPKSDDPRRGARRGWIKFWEYIPEGYDMVITMGGQIKVLCDINDFFNRMYKGDDITCGKHMARRCLYKEANVCITRGKDDSDIIQRQMDYYRNEGYPEMNGLVETGVMIRKNNEVVRQFCSDWFSQIEQWSLRDQLSFNYTLWKGDYDLSIGYYDKKIYLPENKMFKLKSHKSHILKKSQ